jgi:V8-like Glu-specific endopeptidase
MRQVPDKLLACSILISTGKASGSGFIMNFEDSCYLVTAKHVLYNENCDFWNEEISIACPAGEVSDSTIRRYNIKLKDAACYYSNKSDIAIIKYGTAKQKEGESVWQIKVANGFERIEDSVNNPIMIRSGAIKKIDEVFVSNDIYLFGYPTSLSIVGMQEIFDNKRPLLRKGIVASINKKNNTIILDCPVYPGNSGGPVLQVVHSNNKKAYFLIGVVSKYIPYTQEWINNRDNKIRNIEYLNSGYSIAVSMDEVFDLIRSKSNF